MNITQAVQVFKALMEGPASRMQLAKITGAHPKVIGKLLTEMKSHGMVYVISYSNETDGRNRVKIYSLGDHEDAKPLRPTSQEERSRKSYLKKQTTIKRSRIKTTFAGGVSLWQTLN